MAYATTDFYRDTYIGRTCTDDDTLEKWLSRASDDLDIYCINGFDVSALSANALDKLQKACCAQAESYVIYGDDDDEPESFSIGSYSEKRAPGEGSDRSGVLCLKAQKYLFGAGLSFRGVSICSRSHAIY